MTGTKRIKKGGRNQQLKHKNSKKKQPCKVCRKLILALTSPEGSSHRYPTLGSFKEVVLESDCEAHKNLITHYIKPHRDADPNMELVLTYWVLGSMPFIATSSGPPLESPGLSLWSNNVHSVHMQAARIVHPEWIDVNLIRRWKRSCQNTHGTECNISTVAARFSSAGPAWLVDTWTQCIVSALPASSYIALSYVWGSERSYLTSQQNNVEELQQVNSLRRLDYYQMIPNTVKNAIALTEALGERYLWVDSLCIVQVLPLLHESLASGPNFPYKDDEIQKHQELANMAMIYGKASVTIIAREGADAGHGLRGLRGISQPRNFTQKMFQLGRGNRIVERRWRRPDYTLSQWETRGWTFQEELFSCRKIIFDDNCVRWQCRSMMGHEETRVVEQMRDYQQLFTDVLLSGWHPSIRSLVMLLRTYNCRVFSYPEDVLKALWGTLAALRSSFEGGFIGGLPAAFFDIALLWQPENQMYRRTARSSDNQHRWLPSWSWAGWTGSLSSGTWDQASDYIKKDHMPFGIRTTERVVPHVHWRMHTYVDSEGIPIKRNWSKYRKKYLNSKSRPPEGWKRYDDYSSASVPPHLSCPPEGNCKPRCFYKHELLPDYEYWYPIPLANFTDDKVPLTLPSMISCRTRRTRLRGAEWISSSKPVISLRDDNGSWLGALQFTQVPSEKVRTTTAQSHGDVQTLELVEISRGYIYTFQQDLKVKPVWQDKESVFDEWDLEERPKTGDKYEFYNVMCIEWHDGLASRKGLGRVHKESWEQQELEWFDLKLV